MEFNLYSVGKYCFLNKLSCLSCRVKEYLQEVTKKNQDLEEMLLYTVRSCDVCDVYDNKVFL
jgi:hypothetical protein